MHHFSLLPPKRAPPHSPPLSIPHSFSLAHLPKPSLSASPPNHNPQHPQTIITQATQPFEPPGPIARAHEFALGTGFLLSRAIRPFHNRSRVGDCRESGSFTTGERQRRKVGFERRKGLGIYRIVETMSNNPVTPVKVPSSAANYTPATLDPDLRSQINTVLLRDGHVSK